MKAKVFLLEFPKDTTYDLDLEPERDRLPDSDFSFDSDFLALSDLRFSSDFFLASFLLDFFLVSGDEDLERDFSLAEELLEELLLCFFFLCSFFFDLDFEREDLLLDDLLLLCFLSLLRLLLRSLCFISPGDFLPSLAIITEIFSPPTSNPFVFSKASFASLEELLHSETE
jgi:hypothetical protein